MPFSAAVSGLFHGLAHERLHPDFLGDRLGDNAYHMLTTNQTGLTPFSFFVIMKEMLNG